MQDNLYWLSLLTHLQADCVPLKSLDCLRDLRDMYEAATVDDVYDAYAQVGCSADGGWVCHSEHEQGVCWSGHRRTTGTLFDPVPCAQPSP